MASPLAHWTSLSSPACLVPRARVCRLRRVEVEGHEGPEDPERTGWCGRCGRPPPARGVLSAAGVHLEMRPLLERLYWNKRLTAGSCQTHLRSSIGPCRPGRPEEVPQLRRRHTVAQRLTEVGPRLRVEAQIPDPIGGEPAAVAGAAERLCRRGDDAECRAIREPVSIGRGPTSARQPAR